MRPSRAEAAYAQLNRTYAAIDRSHERWLAAVGSNGARYAVLSALAESNGAATPSEISAATGRSPNAISPLLRGLQAEGLIKRTANPDDRRSHYVQLTAGGRRTEQRLRKEEAAFVKAVLGSTADRGLNNLLNALQALQGRAANLKRGA